MARQPDIQYVQLYTHGSAARKMAPLPQYRKEKYQPPEQKVQRPLVKQAVLDPLSVCAIAVATFMMIAMLIGMFHVSELTSRRKALEEYVDVLQEQRADLQKSYEEAYDLTQVEQRARQMGLVYGNEVYHIQMEPVDPEPVREPGWTDRLTALFEELFAKAPR